LTADVVEVRWHDLWRLLEIDFVRCDDRGASERATSSKTAPNDETNAEEQQRNSRREGTLARLSNDAAAAPDLGSVSIAPGVIHSGAA
jgi:hypothetical protein